MGIKWYDKIINVEVFRCVNFLFMEDIFVEKNLRWLGYVYRMDYD